MASGLRMLCMSSSGRVAQRVRPDYACAGTACRAEKQHTSLERPPASCPTATLVAARQHAVHACLASCAPGQECCQVLAVAHACTPMRTRARISQLTPERLLHPHACPCLQLLPPLRQCRRRSCPCTPPRRPVRLSSCRSPARQAQQLLQCLLPLVLPLLLLLRRRRGLQLRLQLPLAS